MRLGLRNSGMDGRALELNDNYNVKSAKRFFNPISSISAGHYILRFWKYSNGYVIQGNFTQVNGVNRPGIAFLNHDLSLSSFNPITGFSTSYAIHWFQELDNGDFYVSGNFPIINGVNRRYVARFNAAGTLQTTPNPSTTTSNYSPTSSVYWNFLEEKGGQLFALGNFTRYNHASTTRGYYHVMTTAAAPVNELTTGFTAMPQITKMPNGKLLFRQAQTNLPISFQGTPMNGMMILGTDYKTVDTEFVIGTGFTSSTASSVGATVFNNNHMLTGTSTVDGAFNGVLNGHNNSYFAIFDQYGSLINMPNKGSGFNGSGQTAMYYDSRNGLYHIYNASLRSYNGSSNCRAFAINESGGHETSFWGTDENNMNAYGNQWGSNVSFLYGLPPLYVKGVSYNKPLIVIDTQSGDFIA